MYVCVYLCASVCLGGGGGGVVAPGRSSGAIGSWGKLQAILPEAKG